MVFAIHTAAKPEFLLPYAETVTFFFTQVQYFTSALILFNCVSLDHSFKVLRSPDSWLSGTFEKCVFIQIFNLVFKKGEAKTEPWSHQERPSRFKHPCDSMHYTSVQGIYASVTGTSVCQSPSPPPPPPTAHCPPCSCEVSPWLSTSLSLDIKHA